MLEEGVSHKFSGAKMGRQGDLLQNPLEEKLVWQKLTHPWIPGLIKDGVTQLTTNASITIMDSQESGSLNLGIDVVTIILAEDNGHRV